MKQRTREMGGGSGLAFSMLVALVASLGCADQMADPGGTRPSVVQVFCLDPSGALAGVGSGFLVGDGRHVATNAHVTRSCATTRIRQDTDRVPLLPAAASAKEGSLPPAVLGRLAGRFAREMENLPNGKVRWISPDSDLALLELERALDRPPVRLAGGSSLREGEAVHAVGFPAVVGRVAFQQGVAYFPQASVTTGAVSNRQKTDLGSVIEHQAQLSEGNSGGPLFDRCGRVVGMNTLVDSRFQNYSWAIDVSGLREGLREAGLDPSRAWGRCAPGLVWSVLQAAGITGAVAAAGFALWIGRRDRRRALGRTLAGVWSTVTRKPLRSHQPRVIGLEGALAGKEVALGMKPIVIGRSPEDADWIVPAGVPGVSRIHCSLWFDEPRGCAWIRDEGSRHGTFLRGSERLAPHHSAEIRRKTRFSLGGREQCFEIRLR